MRNRRIQLNIVFIYLIGCGLIILILQILYTVDKINISAFQETHNNIDKINGRQLYAQSENSHSQWIATVTSRKHFYGPGKTQ